MPRLSSWLPSPARRTHAWLGLTWTEVTRAAGTRPIQLHVWQRLGSCGQVRLVEAGRAGWAGAADITPAVAWQLFRVVSEQQVLQEAEAGVERLGTLCSPAMLECWAWCQHWLYPPPTACEATWDALACAGEYRAVSSHKRNTLPVPHSPKTLGWNSASADAPSCRSPAPHVCTDAPGPSCCLNRLGQHPGQSPAAEVMGKTL